MTYSNAITGESIDNKKSNKVRFIVFFIVIGFLGISKLKIKQH
jgi:hypothetical protein